MTIENTLERIAVALETLAGRATASAAPTTAEKPAAKAAPAKAAATEKPAAKKADTGLFDKLAALTTEAIKKHGKAAQVKELLGEFDVKKASELDASQHAEYYAKLQELVSGGAAEEDEDDLI